MIRKRQNHAEVKSLLAVFAILFCIAASWFVAVQFRPSHEGFTSDGHITTWLVLAPISLSESGADAVGKEQIRGEANLRPQAGDKFWDSGHPMSNLKVSLTGKEK